MRSAPPCSAATADSTESTHTSKVRPFRMRDNAIRNRAPVCYSYAAFGAGPLSGRRPQPSTAHVASSIPVVSNPLEHEERVRMRHRSVVAVALLAGCLAWAIPVASQEMSLTSQVIEQVLPNGLKV